MTVGVTVRFSGPFFAGDVGSRVRQMLHDAVQEVVEMGEQRLDQTLRPRPGGVYLSVQEAGRGKASVGHYRRSIHGEVKGLLGRIDDSKVVYGPWLEGTGSRNQSTRFKGYSSFRKAAQHLEKEKRGVLQKHVKRLAGKLG